MKLKLIPLVLTGSVALSACVANLQNPFSSKLPEQQQAEPVQPAQAAVVKQVSPEQVKRFEKLILSCNNRKEPPELGIGEDERVVPEEGWKNAKWWNVYQLMTELGFELVEAKLDEFVNTFAIYQRDEPLMILGQPTDEVMLLNYFRDGTGHGSFNVVFPKESFKALKKYDGKTFYTHGDDETGAGNYFGRSVEQYEDNGTYGDSVYHEGTYLSCVAESYTP